MTERNLYEQITNLQDKEHFHIEEQQAKVGKYDNPKNGCPNCGRDRVMVGDDGKHRCEKCAWCMEENQIDTDFSDYLFRGF